MEDKNESLVNKLQPGHGLYQQFQQSNAISYNNFSISHLEDILYDISKMPNINNSDPLWLEYKEENDPKLNQLYPTESYRMDILDMSTIKL